MNGAAETERQEWKCSAGDLGADQIGRVVEVALPDGGKMADELIAVRHTASVDGSKWTYVHFKHIPDSQGLFGKQGWCLASDSDAVVRS